VKILIFIVALILIAVPFPSLEAPEWSVSVVNNQNIPLRGVTVRESYQNYSFESVGHDIEIVTGDDGKVLFPAKTTWRNIFLRSFGFLGALTGGIHASFGPHDYVMADGVSPVKNGYLEDWTGRPYKMSSVIVLH
jgi:hypothetical protein